MKTRMMRRAALPAVALATLGVLLAGCSGGGGTAKPSPSPSASLAAVNDTALGKALHRLVFHGTGTKSADGGDCLVEAVKEQGISNEGLAYIVERNSDDMGAVAEGLREVSSMDTAILLSPELSDLFDACVDAVIPPGDGDQSYESPKPVEETAEAAPNLNPKYEIREDLSINSASELTDGLVSMFSSYALDEAQEKTYQAAGECLAGVVFNARFSQVTLRFLAGGAPIGAGSITDHLHKDEDKRIWESKDFTTALLDCTANVTPGKSNDGKA
ncbi:hypothetical protein [Pseudarthrobacter sp. GA104]|uniref:hypothetical protein n=1 Tax=Pseudarthrobacter sp. GA104 TaxID=2676311 RepID=UPI0012F7A3D8|nr:hypothetical protein [Pseudarthrobacter sp. GA104]MUU73402.1 hypothetical protein [Pseudarthrobacter sp. GA104]